VVEDVFALAVRLGVAEGGAEQAAVAGFEAKMMRLPSGPRTAQPESSREDKYSCDTNGLYGISDPSRELPCRVFHSPGANAFMPPTTRNDSASGSFGSVSVAFAIA
jgi:hypothetical protein